jgi:hypothetical protein
LSEPTQADETDPSAVAEPVDDEAKPEPKDDERPAARRAVAPPPRGVITSIVAVACGYELVADVVNMALEENVLPSMATGIGKFRGKAFVGRLVPAGAGVALTLAGGYVVGVVTRGRFASKRR